MRIRLEQNSIHLYPICQLWFSVIADPPTVDSIFISSWAVASPSQANDTFEVSVSCMKWETLCLLSKVILTNINLFMQCPTEEDNRYRLRDAVACAQRATVELNEWRNGGNLSSWDSVVIPLEIDFGYFKALEELSSVLFQLYSLSMVEDDGVLAHTSLLADLLNRLSLLSDQDFVPDILVEDLICVYKAIDEGVSTEVVRAAHSAAKKGNHVISWREVIYWQTRVVSCHAPGILYKSQQLLAAEDDLQTITRIAGATQLQEPEIPTAKGLGFELKFAFPFYIKTKCI